MTNISLFITLFVSLHMVSGKLSAQTTTLPPAVYSRIPAWLHEPLQAGPDRLLIIGISDPGLPDSVARQQAFIRGVALASLAIHSECSYLSDFYTKEVKKGADSKYEEIYRISTLFSGDLDEINILDKTILSSREAVLLLEVPLRESTTVEDVILIVETMLYNYEFEVSNRKRLMRKHEFSLQLNMGGDLHDLDDISFFRLNRKATGIQAFIPQSQVAYDSLEFYYSSFGSSETLNDQFQPGTSTTEGLWIAYLSQILEQISFCVNKACDETARVSDRTSTTSIELNREKKSLLLSWRVHKLILEDQRLHVDFSCNSSEFDN
ncbi:MAG: hypothetical protein ISR57_02565 [Bacteroidales bacterium]|nr:hypothetical protein [Bacteroidales bacterium]